MSEPEPDMSNQKFKPSEALNPNPSALNPEPSLLCGVQRKTGGLGFWRQVCFIRIRR